MPGAQCARSLVCSAISPRRAGAAHRESNAFGLSGHWFTEMYSGKSAFGAVKAKMFRIERASFRSGYIRRPRHPHSHCAALLRFRGSRIGFSVSRS